MILRGQVVIFVGAASQYTGLSVHPRACQFQLALSSRLILIAMIPLLIPIQKPPIPLPILIPIPILIRVPMQISIWILILILIPPIPLLIGNGYHGLFSLMTRIVRPP